MTTAAAHTLTRMVPAQVRTALEEARQAGEPFETAWPAATAAVLASEPDEGERRAWEATLDATRGPWEAAYGHETPPAPQRALALLGADPERCEPIAGLPPGARECAMCDGAIAAHKRPAARFCARECQRAANGRHAGLAEAA